MNDPPASPQGGFGAGGTVFGTPSGGGFGYPDGQPSSEYGAPPGGYGGFGQGPSGDSDPELAKSLSNWTIVSCCMFFFGCGLLALIPILSCNAGKESLKNGNVEDARSKLKTAKICCYAGFGWAVLCIGLFVLYILLGVVFGVLGALS